MDAQRFNRRDPAGSSTAVKLLPAALAAALCSVGIAWGTPDLQEEAFPLRKAFEMWGWGGEGLQLDPATAGWPALSFYVHLLLQQLHFGIGRLFGSFGDRFDYFVAYLRDPTVMVVLARLLGVFAAAGSVAVVTRVGVALGGLQAGLLAGLVLAVSPLLVDQAHLVTPDILMVLLVALALRGLVGLSLTGTPRSAAWAGVWIGLGAATKYTPGLLVATLIAVVLWRRRQEGRPVLGLLLRDKRLWVGLAATVLAFVAASPFTLLRVDVLRRDVGYQLVHISAGHFGHAQLGSGYVHYLRDVLGPGLGWPALVTALIGLAWAAARRGGPWLVPLAVAVPFYLFLGGLRTQFDRYMLPLLPALALGVAAAWAWAHHRWEGKGPGTRRLVTGVVVLLMVAPGLVGTLRGLRGRRTPTTLELAREWLLENVDRDTEFVAREAYTPALSRDPRTEEDSRPVLDQLSPAQRDRVLTTPFFATVELPLYSTRAELTAPYYDLRHLRPYRWIVISGAVRRRYESEPERFPRQLRFYELLESRGTLVREFSAADGPGPHLWFYRMDDAAWEALLEDEGRLGETWAAPWDETLHPEHFRRFVETVAYDAFGQGDWDTAAVYYGTLYRIVEAEARMPVEFRLAYAKLQAGQLADAETLYRRLLQRDPNDPVANGNLAYLAQLRGERDEAQRLYRRAIEVDDVGEIARWARDQLQALEEERGSSPAENPR